MVSLYKDSVSVGKDKRVGQFDALTLATYLLSTQTGWEFMALVKEPFFLA